MPRVMFSEKAWEEYLWWQTQDRKKLKRINALLQEIGRGEKPFGKAERLKGSLAGSMSVRIDEANRLVYRVMEGMVVVEQCKGHYDD